VTVAANHVIGFSRRSHKNLIAPHSENQRSQSWALGANVEDAREEAMTSASGGGRHPSSRDQATALNFPDFWVLMSGFPGRGYDLAAC